ncbi:DEAD/DEAH box helicase family protein [Thalassobacillus devorans]|uniref:DEAD/DEAH box helicase family protein n=1 Tax=Thalassobacillus devorans TaxID=279813 RepID=UPI0020CAE319|nr:DEAD/DEAH box helicase family protein [Thalassobacillus devorans]
MFRIEEINYRKMVEVLKEFISMSPVQIIDATCGKGKTSWAIQSMNEADESEKFMFITPFLSEVDRIKKSVTSRRYSEPEVDKDSVTKLDSLKKLVRHGKNIVSTHELFSNIDEATLKFIKSNNYTLILDEVANVIEQAQVSKDDINLLLGHDGNEPYVTVDENGFVKWKRENYDGAFKRIERLAKTNNLMIFNDTAMFWTFPVSVFRAFKKVNILTYMFWGQSQRYYFKMFGVPMYFNSVELDKVTSRYKLIPYVKPTKENVAFLKQRINIYYPLKPNEKDMNAVGEKRGAFSNNWLTHQVKDKEMVKLIKSHAYNFYWNKCKVKSEQMMWTCLKDFENKITPKSAKKQFVSLTARATNDYIDKEVCVYLANRFMNPVEKKFFQHHNVKVDEDFWALSELIQWLFRSRIRRYETIDLYIPSSRMRGLLETYLSGEAVAWFEQEKTFITNSK